MKALVFAFNDQESATWSDRIAVQLQRIGWQTVQCDLASDGGFDPTRLARPRSSASIVLSDGGLNSIPRLSDRDYRRVFGDDLDFASISGLEFFAGGYPLAREFLVLESPYYQRLRGIAARVEHLLRAVAPDLVLVQQGSRPVPRIFLAKAVRLGIPWLCWESAFFAGHLLLDPAGQHFLPGRNKIDLDWPRVGTQALDEAQSARTADFIRTWLDSRSSKYPQDTCPQESARLEAFLEAGEGPVLFVPMQVPLDANVYHGVGGYPSLDAFYQAILADLPAGWRVVFKPHPKARMAGKPVVGEDARVFVAGRCSIHDLLAAADVVAVFSSNVGLEALLRDKPVVAAGRPCYAGKGLTIDARDASELPTALRQALGWRCDPVLKARLVHYLIADYLVREGDDEALRRRIGEAGQYPLEPARPFLACDPRPTHDYLELVQRYDALAALDMTEAQAFSRLRIAIPGAASDPASVVARDRVASAWLTRIDPAHLARYAFVAALIPAGCRVLDFACGSGYGSYLLAARGGARVLAVDGAAEAIDYAMANWRHPHVGYRVASAHEGPPTETVEGFDVIVCLETLAWLRRADSFLGRLWQRLRPGGVLFVSAANRLVRPVRDSSFQVETYDPTRLTALFSGLPELATQAVYGQHGNRIDAAEPGAAGHLMAVAFKQPAGASWAVSPEALRLALPFTHPAPAKEFAGPGDVLRMLARRRGWLLGLAGRLLRRRRR